MKGKKSNLTKNLPPPPHPQTLQLVARESTENFLDYQTFSSQARRFEFSRRILKRRSGKRRRRKSGIVNSKGGKKKKKKKVRTPPTFSYSLKSKKRETGGWFGRGGRGASVAPCAPHAFDPVLRKWSECSTCSKSVCR